MHDYRTIGYFNKLCRPIIIDVGSEYLHMALYVTGQCETEVEQNKPSENWYWSKGYNIMIRNISEICVRRVSARTRHRCHCALERAPVAFPR